MSLLGRPFALLWAGQSASLLGDQVTRLALPLAATLGGHASVGRIAALAAAAQIPFLALGLPAGGWVDRWGARRAMLAADAVRAVALASVPATALVGTVAYGQLLVTALVVGVASVPFQLAYQSVVPSLVAPAALPAANRRLTLSESLAGLLGPAAAGALAGTVGAVRALGVDAASYLVSVGTLLAMPAVPGGATRDTAAPANGIRAGIRYVLGRPPLRALLWASVLFNAGFAGYEALETVFAVRTLGLSPALLGVAVAAGGAAVPLGVALSRFAERRWGRGVTLVVAAAFSSAGPFLVAAAGTGTGAALLAAGSFVTGVGGGCWGVTALTARQTLAEATMRVRATATHRFASLGVLPLGAGGAGLLADLAGTRLALVVLAALGALSVLPLLRVPMRAYTPAPVGT